MILSIILFSAFLAFSGISAQLASKSRPRSRQGTTPWPGLVLLEQGLSYIYTHTYDDPLTLEHAGLISRSYLDETYGTSSNRLLGLLGHLALVGHYGLFGH